MSMFDAYHSDIHTPGVENGYDLDQRYNAAMAGSGQMVDRRGELLNQLQGIGQGQGSGVGDVFYKNATDQNQNQQMALAGSGRGGNAGLAARAAMLNAANFNQNAAQQGAMLKAQEAQQARTEAGGLINSGIGMNNQLLGQQANMYMSAQGTNAGYDAKNYMTPSQTLGAVTSLGSSLGGMAPSIFGGGGSAGGAAGGSQVGAYQSRDGTINPMDNAAGLMAKGGRVPGKAVVSGDSFANDTVPARLSPGEIVVPRSVSESSDPVRGTAGFVAALMAHEGKAPIGKALEKSASASTMEHHPSSFGAILAAQAQLHERMKKLETLKGKKNA